MRIDVFGCKYITQEVKVNMKMSTSLIFSAIALCTACIVYPEFTHWFILSAFIVFIIFGPVIFYKPEQTEVVGTIIETEFETAKELISELEKQDGSKRVFAKRGELHYGFNKIYVDEYGDVILELSIDITNEKRKWTSNVLDALDRIITFENIFFGGLAIIAIGLCILFIFEGLSL